MTISDVVHPFTHFAVMCAQRLSEILIHPASQFSLISLLVALTLAAAFLISKRPASRPVPLRVLIRALIPRRWYRSSSSHADMGMMVFNMFISVFLVGWAICSAVAVEHFLSGRLDSFFGPERWIHAPLYVAVTISTLGTYVAYEFAYFSNHYLSHHIPFFWQFHRTHHTAETLSPMTNYRVHPVDSIFFYNTVGLCIGGVTAVVKHMFGIGADEFTIAGSNVLLLTTLYLLTHLHHSHMWISFSGRLGKVVMSPAHHQVHHSADPKHFNRNFGNGLALFDWFAGTLYVPSKKREYLTFGGGPLPYDPHTVTGTLVMPFVDAANLLKRTPAAAETYPREPQLTSQAT